VRQLGERVQNTDAHVSVPVRAHNARVSGAGPIPLHQLRADCHSRIQYRKTCPIHGEVTIDNIVLGYEYAKGQYVVVDPAELDKLRSEDDKAITIDKFIHPESLDRVYLSGQSYYLLPEGRVGEMEGVVTKPEALDELAPKAEPGPEEMELARKLIEASSTEELDFSQYKNLHKERMTKLIDAKVAGKEVVAPPPQEDRQIINLMDALRQSIAQSQKAGEEKETEAAKPPRKMAASKRGQERERMRKSS
jgi:DNA end-binding protein Ku